MKEATFMFRRLLEQSSIACDKWPLVLSRCFGYIQPPIDFFSDAGDDRDVAELVPFMCPRCRKIGGVPMRFLNNGLTVCCGFCKRLWMITDEYDDIDGGHIITRHARHYRYVPIFLDRLTAIESRLEVE